MKARFAISKSSKYCLIAFVVLFLMITLIQLDMGETVALGWHLRHGFNERCCGVEVAVPLKYIGGSGLPLSLSLNAVPGYLRARLLHAPHAMILITSNPRPLDEEHARQASERWILSWTRNGYHLVGTKAIQVAGSFMNCSELYTESFRTFGPDYNVWCTGENITASFSGSPALLTEFYSLMERARPTIEEIRTTR